MGNEEKPTGSHEAEFKFIVSGLQLASEIHYYKLQAGSFVRMKKMILIK